VRQLSNDFEHRVAAAAAKLSMLVIRYGSDSVAWLSKILTEWGNYKTKVRCSQCGSTNIKWIDDYSYECENGHRDKVLGIEAWELGVPSWFMRALNDMGLVNILYKSRSATCYGVPSTTAEAINRVLSAEAVAVASRGTSTATVVAPAPHRPIDVSVFDEIVGYDDVKKIIAKALNSPKSVHIMLVGPPSSAKTMFLEAIANFYGVPILVAGASTGPGIRNFIADYVPRVLVIDELDKRRDPQDLSVLLTWMESQRLVITMVTRREVIECPDKGCRVVAAANTLDPIPRELLSRFTIIEFEEYKESEVRDICISILTKREGVSKELAEKIAEAVVKELGSKDPRDCIKVARLAGGESELSTVVSILKKRRPKKRTQQYKSGRQ
jgi:Holliday junction DNA helicase RuvB